MHFGPAGGHFCHAARLRSWRSRCRLLPARTPTTPTGRFRSIVPFAAGSASDVITRILLNRMATSLGQNFVVENRPGAGGNTGTAAAAHAAPDGYTLVMSTSGPLAANKALFKELGYDPQKDFAPICLFATLPNIVVINAKLPPKTLARPDRLREGNTPSSSITARLASAPHNISPAPISNSSPERNWSTSPTGILRSYTPDFISGQVPVGFQLLPNVLGLITERRCARAGGGQQRTHDGVARCADGCRGRPARLRELAWLALLAPANIDKALVDKLYAAAQDATKDPKVRALFAEQGAEPTDLGPEDLKKFMASEISKWSEVIGKMGIAPM